jgi:hypothetical protein
VPGTEPLPAVSGGWQLVLGKSQGPRVMVLTQCPLALGINLGDSIFSTITLASMD